MDPLKESVDALGGIVSLLGEKKKSKEVQEIDDLLYFLDNKRKSGDVDEKSYKAAKEHLLKSRKLMLALEK